MSQVKVKSSVLQLLSTLSEGDPGDGSMLRQIVQGLSWKEAASNDTTTTATTTAADAAAAAATRVRTPQCSAPTGIHVSNYSTSACADHRGPGFYRLERVS